MPRGSKPAQSMVESTINSDSRSQCSRPTPPRKIAMTENSTVFIIDDDPGALESLRWLLEQADFRVKALSSGREFLDSYRDEDRGCLVLDVRMPEMNGLELQQILRDRKIRLPIIFMTAHGDVPTCAAPSAEERPIFWRSQSTTRCCWHTSKDSSPRTRSTIGRGGGGMFRRPHNPAHADRTRDSGRFDRREEHQGHCPRTKDRRADRLAASKEHSSQGRRGKPHRVGSHRYPVADSTRTASAERRLRCAKSQTVFQLSTAEICSRPVRQRRRISYRPLFASNCGRAGRLYFASWIALRTWRSLLNCSFSAASEHRSIRHPVRTEAHPFALLVLLER